MGVSPGGAALAHSDCCCFTNEARKGPPFEIRLFNILRFSISTGCPLPSKEERLNHKPQNTEHANAERHCWLLTDGGLPIAKANPSRDQRRLNRLLRRFEPTTRKVV